MRKSNPSLPRLGVCGMGGQNNPPPQCYENYCQTAFAKGLQLCDF